jgi:phage portal protein BeeE
MGTGDSTDLGSPARPSRGYENVEGGKFSSVGRWAEGFAAGRETFGNSSHGGRAKQRQIKSLPNVGARMSKFLRKPEAFLWILSISQAAAMLAFNVILRAAVS